MCVINAIDFSMVRLWLWIASLLFMMQILEKKKQLTQKKKKRSSKKRVNEEEEEDGAIKNCAYVIEIITTVLITLAVVIRLSCRCTFSLF